MSRNLDLTTITIIASGLHAAAEEMGVNLVRSAFSQRDVRNESFKLFDLDRGVIDLAAPSGAKDQRNSVSGRISLSEAHSEVLVTLFLLAIG